MARSLSTIRSRRGNLVVAVLGVLYSVTAALLLAAFLVQTWAGVSRADLLMQLITLVSLVSGVWLLRIAARNLGIALPTRRRSGIRGHVATA
jgi:hypothetical protein